MLASAASRKFTAGYIYILLKTELLRTRNKLGENVRSLVDIRRNRPV